MAGLSSARLSLKELWKACCKAQACLRRSGHENETSDNPDAGFVASLLNCANRHGSGRTNRSGVRKVRKWTVERALAASSQDTSWYWRCSVTKASGGGSMATPPP